MNNLGNILAYLFSNHPSPSTLSKARVVKMIYLADWKSAIENGKQITSINWIHNHYGPYVDEILDYIRGDARFEICQAFNNWGENKEIIKLIKKQENINISKEEKTILDFVITQTSKLYWKDFIKLIYSTYPIRMSEKFSALDLIKLGKEYKSAFNSPVGVAIHS